MATAPGNLVNLAAAPTGLPAAPGSVWRAPLVPVALVFTAGVVFDRYASPPLAASVSVAALALLAALCALSSPRPALPLVYLGLAGAAFGATYHHYRHDFYPADDIGNVAPAEPRPALLRGRLDEEPFHAPPLPSDPLRSLAKGETTATVLRATHLRQRDDWAPVSGRVRLLVAGKLEGLHVGDEVEAVGQLAAPQEPSNPGEFDYSAYLRDQGIRAVLVVRKTPGGVTRLARGWTGSPSGWVAVVRGWGQDVLKRELPQRTRGVAVALLLGEGAPMTAADWDKYIRTGVIHVLAISGQHLAVLALFLWWALRALGVRQRHGAWLVAFLLLGYAVLTGGRPPALRSGVVVFAACLGLILRRPGMPANLFALGWLAVGLLNPTDLFASGCLLSFLSVAVLYWCARPLLQREHDPLDIAIDHARPAWLRCLRWVGRWVLEGYVVSLLIWLAITPLAASRYNLIAPVGILLGPVLTVLASFALFAGFGMLGAAALCPLLTPLFARVVHLSLSACEWLVDAAVDWPFSHVYVGNVPEGWLWLFYGALLAVLTQAPLRRHWRWASIGGVGWLYVGLLGGAARLPPDELRVTFLAVGHGDCTVLELPDGRTLLYDAGAIGGPDVTRRQIAPFLWSRGVRRIDEVFLSHADLDHFNGLPDLLWRFAVGQVTCTPTFADKHTGGVTHTLDAIRRHGVPVRIVKAGDRLTAGDVSLDVLHPPAAGPEGNENARSLVLCVRHAGHTLLLTGDLEGPGLEQVLRLAPHGCDVMQAPHHGSRRLDAAGLTAWARPRLVVSCQGRPRGAPGQPEAYTQGGCQFLGTWPEGAVTIISHRSGLVIETFKTRQRLALRDR
jgi:competence protein ComEC